MTKVLAQYRQLTMVDFPRKVLYVIARTLNFMRWSRKLSAVYHFKSADVTIGRGVRIHGQAHRISMGNNISVYDNCIFELSHTSDLSFGDNLVLSYGVIICCRGKITIGRDVQVGEYSSIRDSTHQYSSLGKPMKYQPDTCLPVVIGDDVWIGRGCLILPGSVVENGVVIAAHSVVRGHLKSNGIYGGTPAKLIKLRTDL